MVADIAKPPFIGRPPIKEPQSTRRYENTLTLLIPWTDSQGASRPRARSPCPRTLLISTTRAHLTKNKHSPPSRPQSTQPTQKGVRHRLSTMSTNNSTHVQFTPAHSKKLISRIHMRTRGDERLRPTHPAPRKTQPLRIGLNIDMSRGVIRLCLTHRTERWRWRGPARRGRPQASADKLVPCPRSGLLS